MAGLEEWPALVSDIQFKRYDIALQKFQAILFSRDAGSMLTTRRRIAEMLRNTAFKHLKSMADKLVKEKLDMLQFLHCAFSCTHDVESKLVIRYEALVLQEVTTPINLDSHVSIEKWISFAEDCLHNGFTSNAIKDSDIFEGTCWQETPRRLPKHFFSVWGYDKALLHMASINDANEESSKHREKVDETREMRDFAHNMLSTKSVQVEAARHIKRMSKSKLQPQPMSMKDAASSRYKIGIKMRNLRKLREYQAVKLYDCNNI